MKLWFIIGAVIAIVLTGCAGENNNQDKNFENTSLENQSEETSSENSSSENNSEALCCLAMTASCLACQAEMSIQEYCDENPDVTGCTADGPPTEDNRNEVLEEEFIEEIPDKPRSTSDQTTTLSEVSCEDDALSFTIKNTISRTMVMSTLSFPAPDDKTQLAITINNYNPWKTSEYFYEQSLRDCFDGTIEPGDEIRCTISPVPVVTENAYSKNTILVQAQGIYTQQTFTCS